jgi:hypothetical protein
MKNETEHYIEITQDPETCKITMNREGYVQSNPIHFVVIPEVTAKRLQVIGSQVHCANETDPEEVLFVNLADDVIYEMTAQLFEVRFDPSATDPSLAVSLEGIGEPGQDNGRRRFWDAPDTWQSNLRPFPPAPEIFTTLGLGQIVNVHMELFETDSETDQAILETVLVLAAIALVVLILVLVAATIIALIATGVITAASFGAGAAPTLIVAALATFLVGAAFAALRGAIELIVAAMPSIETIGAAGTGFMGLELAHRLSPIRLHRLFWTQERSMPEDPSANLNVIESVFENGDYREVFRVNNLGGCYEVTLTVNSE